MNRIGVVGRALRALRRPRPAVAAAAAIAITVFSPATAQSATVTTFAVPVTGMATTLPMIYPPQNPFAVVYPTATTGDRPGITTFAIADAAVTYPVDVGVAIRWHNLTSGASGVVEISSTPTEVATGPGQIVATATVAPSPWALTLTPGFGTFLA